MHQLVGYHRPATVAEAVRLLAEPNRVVLAGGTTLRHDGGAAPVEVVDIQALDLDSVEADAPLVGLGATATLQALVDNDAVPDLVRRTARAELPSTLRSLATVGGTIGSAENDSLLLAALLVHDATVHFADERTAVLGDVLDVGLDAGDLIVGVTVAAVGATAMHATGRTLADRPIVAAVGRVTDTGVRLALCGIAATPRLVDPADVDTLEPPGDFRGSPRYRRHLADVLDTSSRGAVVTPTTFELNGENVTVEVQPHDSLFTVLRGLGMFSVKYGSATGETGAAAVLLDGALVSSEVVLALQAHGHRVTTVEVLNTGPGLHPIQAAFAATGALQSGYSAGAMVLGTMALLERDPDPSDDAIRDMLSGILDRESGYVKPVEAVRRRRR